MQTRAIHPDAEDLVDQVMAAFGVGLSCEFSEETCLGQLEDAVVAAVGKAGSHRCRSSVVFWRLRRALGEAASVPKGAVVPFAFLNDLIPRRGRRKVWSAIERSLGVKLPSLAFQAWANYLSCAISLLPLIWGLFEGLRWLCLPLAMLMPFMWALILHFASPLRNTFPDHLQTVRDLVRTVLALNFADMEGELGPAHEREVRESVKRVVADATGVNPEWLCRETSLLDLVTSIDFKRNRSYSSN